MMGETELDLSMRQDEVPPLICTCSAFVRGNRDYIHLALRDDHHYYCTAINTTTAVSFIRSTSDVRNTAPARVYMLMYVYSRARNLDRNVSYHHTGIIQRHTTTKSDAAWILKGQALHRYSVRMYVGTTTSSVQLALFITVPGRYSTWHTRNSTAVPPSMSNRSVP